MYNSYKDYNIFYQLTFTLYKDTLYRIFVDKLLEKVLKMKDFNSQEDFINGLTENIKTNRSSLVGEKFNIISMMGEVKYEVEVNKLIGEGASALVYEVSVDDTYPPIKKMIMKEFYPNYNEDNIVAERNPINRLELYFDAITSKDEQRIKKDRNKFIDAYNKHIRILEMDSFFDSKIVRPYRVEIDNSFLYSLYEVDSATSVDKYYNLDLARIVDILIQTADILIHLHNNDIIYMDLKPANILYDYNNSRVKLFDFDAAIDLNELDQINEFAMPSDKTFIPPEIRFISDISKRKEIFITEEIDLYMLAATFFTLLMARTPTVKENEDMDLLERNLREVLNHKSNKILINQKSEDEIVSLLQDTLSIHRLISVRDFKDRLIGIQDNIRFRDDEEFSAIISASYFLDYHRLYNYITEDKEKKNIDVAIVGNNDVSKIFFSYIFSVANIKDVNLNISFYDRNPKIFYKEMIEENPLLSQTSKIFLNKKLVNDYINPQITDKAYANINFFPLNERIYQSYILILDPFGYNYPHLGDILYNEFKADSKKRIILNYSRNNHKVDIRHEGNIAFYNLDLTSTSTSKNRYFSDKLLDEAFEFYRYHIVSNHGERVDNERVWSNFIENDFYNLKSSLRVALSIEYYKYMAGIKESDDVAFKFSKEVIYKDSDDGKASLHDMLADYEHHSWNRFMIVQGFKVPTDEQLRSYSYVDQKKYVDYRNKYHPLISNTHSKVLKKGGEDNLSKISQKIDEIIRQKTIYKEEQVRSRVNNILNNTLWDDNEYLIKLRPLWIELYKLSDSIIENEYYTNNSLNILTYEIEEILNEASPDLKQLSNDYYQIKNDLTLIIKRNKSTDIKAVDYMIIDSIPLVSSKRVKTIYKPFLESDENLWANIIAAIKFYPEKLIFLSDYPVDSNKIYRIENFLKNKRLQKSLKIETITYDKFKDYSKENSIVDLTLNSHADAKREELIGLEFVEYIGSNNWCGNYKALDYYIYNSSLTVEETFFLNNARIIDNDSLVSITRLKKYYPRIWQTYINLSSDDWKNCIEAINASEKYYRLNIDNFPKQDQHNLIEVGDFKFRKNDAGKYNSLKNLLDQLIKEEILIAYQFPKNPGSLKLHSYNDKLSKVIGEFISKNMWEYNLYFNLVKTELAEKNYAYSYSIYSDKLNFSYEYEVDNPKGFAKKFNNIIEAMDKESKLTDTRIFNHIDNKPYAESLEKKVMLNYEYGDVGFREFFSRKGSLLRVYTYFELLKYSEFFDDIKIEVNLRWKAYDDYREDSLAIENVLDLVCTKGFSTIIISTVEGNIKNEDLYEINNDSKQFGMDAKPVLITSNSNDDTSQIKMIAAAAGVYFIDREMIVENNVADYIKNIALGKKDWQNIE